MPQTSNQTTQGALLKELYTLPPVRVLNDKSFLHDKLKKEAADVDFSGKWVRFPVSVRRALGRGSRADGGVLPVAIAEVDVEAKAFIKFHYYALEWTEALEEVSKSKEGSFENAVSRKMKNLSIDMAKELNRQWYNPALGSLAKITTDNAAGTSQVVDSVQYLQIGDLIDIVEANGTPITSGASRTITAINKTTRAITLDVSVDPSGDELIVLAGNYGNESEGLRAFADSNRTLHGIDGVVYPEWNGNKVTLSGAIAGESSFEQLSDKIGERGRGDMDTYIGTRGIRRRLADEFASQRRYMNEATLDIKAGYRSLEVNGHEFVVDDDAPKGHVFALSRDVLKILQLTQPGFMQSEAGDAAEVHLKDHTTAGMKVAAWQAWYRYHCALVCVDPARTGMIPDAEDDAVA